MGRITPPAAGSAPSGAPAGPSLDSTPSHQKGCAKAPLSEPHPCRRVGAARRGRSGHAAVGVQRRLATRIGRASAHWPLVPHQGRDREDPPGARQIEIRALDQHQLLRPSYSRLEKALDSRGKEQSLGQAKQSGWPSSHQRGFASPSASVIRRIRSDSALAATSDCLSITAARPPQLGRRPPVGPPQKRVWKLLRHPFITAIPYKTYPVPFEFISSRRRPS